MFWSSSHSPNLLSQIALLTQFSFTHFQFCHRSSLFLISMCPTLFLGLPLLLKPVKSLAMGKGEEKCKNEMRRWGIIPRNGTNPLPSPNLKPHNSFSFGWFSSFLLSLRYISQIFFFKSRLCLPKIDIFSKPPKITHQITFSNLYQNVPEFV